MFHTFCIEGLFSKTLHEPLKIRILQLLKIFVQKRNICIAAGNVSQILSCDGENNTGRAIMRNGFLIVLNNSGLTERVAKRRPTMRIWTVPKFFRDILGETTEPLTLALIVVVTVIVMSVLTVEGGALFVENGLVRGGLAFILIADVIAGTIANFSKGTNDFYAKRSLNRWIFIVVHVHPLVIAWLLRFSLKEAWILWGYVILAAVVVNLCMGKAYQRILAASLTSIGLLLVLVIYKDLPTVMIVMALFFVLKLVFSFCVDHEKIGRAHV